MELLEQVEALEAKEEQEEGGEFSETRETQLIEDDELGAEEMEELYAQTFQAAEDVFGDDTRPEDSY